MEGVLDALASCVQNMLTDMVKEEVDILLRVTGEIKNMGVKLGDLKNFLADADRRNITDLSVQGWVKELRCAMYEATNILDLCQLKAMEQGPSKDMGCLNPLLFCMRDPLHAHDIGRRIKNLNSRLDLIKKRSSSLNFIDLGSYEDRGRSMVSPNLSTRETSWGLDESSLVGDKIEEDTRNLVEMLTHEHETQQPYMVFAIVGVGGIGKTTLAQKIFRYDVIQQKFTKIIWLSVNKDFNETQLLKRAIAGAKGDLHAPEHTKSTLERSLMEALMGHKTLLIMDDVWDHRAWEGVLKTPFVNAFARGSCVLVTTRHNTVARRMLAEEPYHRISKLGPEDAWLLLKKQVVGNANNDEQMVDALKDIGMAIIEKCDGLPLAIRVMGGLLREKMTRRSDWEYVLNDSAWSVSPMPEELNSVVFLSYQDLPPNLKPCFLHFALLPNGREFWDDYIIAMWISEGFIHGNSSHDLEMIGRRYYDQLISRNLIQPNLRSTEQGVCNMHDVVRSFAQYVARDEALVTLKSEDVLDNKHNSQNFIQLSIDIKEPESNQIVWSTLQAHTSLRTLILVGQIKINPGDSLLPFSCLRVLHIEGNNVDALSESLVQLKHLRYLSIRNSNTCGLPENIAKMKLLQHIDLVGCKNMEKLPSGIVKLHQLRLLGLNGTGIKNIPIGFGGLTNLRKLYGFPGHMEGDWCSLEELGPLNQLMRLNIYGLENVSSSSFAIKARLAEKLQLRYMHLNCTSRDGDVNRLLLVQEEEKERIKKVFDELCPPPCIENLRIIRYFSQQLPRWMMSTAAGPLENLRSLILDDLVCCMELPNGLSQLHYLKYLQINMAPAIKRVGHEFICCRRSKTDATFSSLLELRFKGMVEWEEWDWEKDVKAMPLLEFLRLERCKLRHIPSALAFHARTLKILCIYDVKNLSFVENFFSVVHLEVFGNTDLQRISNLPKLQKLVIVRCSKMKVLEGMPVLQKLELEDYDMETVPRYVQDVKPRHMTLHCSLLLLTYIAGGKSSHEWNRFNHLQQVKAYSTDGTYRKRHVLYTRDPFCIETNISHSAISKARHALTCDNCSGKCPIEDEWPVGHTSAVKRQPLCVRFRCNAHRHLFRWLRQACLHCHEMVGNAPSSDQWIDAPEFGAGHRCLTKYGWLQQQQKETMDT